MIKNLKKTVLKLDNGYSYKGQTFFGYPTGEGQLFDKDKKLVYDGMWLLGKPNGLGKYINADDEVFEGMFRNGYRNGHGKIYNEKGVLIQEGIWQFGKPVKSFVNLEEEKFENAEKFAILQDDIIIEVSDKFLRKHNPILLVSKIHNIKIQCSQDCLYLGANNKKKPSEVIYQLSNGTYIGTIQDGRFNGEGTYYYPDGSYHKGTFKDGNFNGLGVYYDNNQKKTYEGNWKNDHKSGEFTVTYQDGTQRKLSFLKDELEKGHFDTFVYNDGTVYEGEELDGKPAFGSRLTPSKELIVSYFIDYQSQPSTYVEIYDENYSLINAGMLNKDKQVEGYFLDCSTPKSVGEFICNSTQDTGYGFIHHDCQDLSTLTTELRNEFVRYDIFGKFLRQDTICEVEKQFGNLTKEQILNEENFLKRKELFLKRRNEFADIFQNHIENINLKSIQKYLEVPGIKPAMAYEDEVFNIESENKNIPNEKPKIEKPKIEKANTEKIKMDKIVTNKDFDVDKFIEDKFEDLVGLDDVKRQIKNIFALRTLQGHNFKISDMNMTFVGNPGTGKTTVGEIFTSALFQLGIIPEDKFVKVSFKDLYKRYMGNSLEAINKKIEEAKGGVLFLDDVQQLINENDSSNSYKQEIQNALITALEENRNDEVFIFAGYKSETEKFLRTTDKGLSSRISRAVTFEDFSTEDLAIIFTRMISKEKNYADKPFEIDDEAIGTIFYAINDMRSQKGSLFGNARDVRVFVRKVLEGFARVNKDKDRTLITNQDLRDMNKEAFNGKLRICEDIKTNGGNGGREA